MEYIKVKKQDIFKIGIADEQGNPKLDENGKEVCLEFDLEDIGLAERLSKCDELITRAKNVLKMRIATIEKHEDKAGKKLMTKNQEDKLNAMKEYYKSTEEAMDLFLGENGTQKVFGDRRYWEMYDDLAEMLAPIMPKMKLSVDSIIDRVKSKYSIKEENVLKND